MYIPKINILSDPNRAIDFMQRFNFATMISTIDSRPVATHLPFIVTKTKKGLFLNSHMAKANPQWKSLVSQDVLVIFSEPHAYISPKLYNKNENVPTWDYISVHAYGKTQLIEDKVRVLEGMQDMITLFDKAYQKQWESLPPEYIDRLLNGVIAFQIKVDDLQAKEKISQDKTHEEKNNIIESLEKSNSESERQIAEYMKKRNNKY